MIHAEHLNFAYPDGTQALKGISFDIEKGESVAFVGENGAGKSTLFRLLVGIDLPSEQSVLEIRNLAVTKKHIRKIRQIVGMVFQNPDDQLFMTKVYNDVAFGPRNAGYSEEAVEQSVLEALEKLNILHLKDKIPTHLSGGQKRMASIAAVLSMHPEVILFDEPSSFLDPRARRALINTLQSLDTTKMIATHDLDLALDVCSRVIIIKDGCIQADGDAAEILSDDALLQSCGLELPLSLQR